MCDEITINSWEDSMNRYWSNHSLGGMYCTEDEYLADRLAAYEYFGGTANESET